MAYEWIVDALDQTWRAIDEVVRPQPAGAYDAMTACPGWSVRDILSHLLGFESMLNGEEPPRHDADYPDYVKNEIGRLNEAFVSAHRGEPGIDVLNQFKVAAAQSIERLRALDQEDWERVGWSPEGERPYYRFQETRVLDSWIHLQDIRDALLEPADDHGAGEEIVVNRFEAAVPYVVGKRMGAADGFTLQVNLSGRAGRTVMVAVHDGRCVPVTELKTAPVLEVSTPVALFWRRAAGRISADAFLNASATDIRGDRTAARQFAEGLCVMI